MMDPFRSWSKCRKAAQHLRNDLLSSNQGHLANLANFVLGCIEADRNFDHLGDFDELVRYEVRAIVAPHASSCARCRVVNVAAKNSV